MNRRTFLKSLAIACGAVVVCPGELLKSPQDESVEFKPNPIQHVYMIDHPAFHRLGLYDKNLKLRAIMIRYYRGAYYWNNSNTT